MSSNDLAAAMDVIMRGQRFGLIAHQNPDGDALGSALGMAHLLRSQGKEAFVSWPSPWEGALERYHFLPGINEAVPPNEMPEVDVIMSFDCASLQRLGEHAALFAEVPNSIVVDHHFSNPGFGNINVIDVDAAATAVVVFEMAKALEWPLSREAAICLYTGLVTDTGRFQYSNTGAREFGIAYELASYEIPIAELSRELFEKDRFSVLQLTSRMVDRAKLDNEIQFVWSYLTDEDLAEFGVRRQEVEGFIDILRRTSEAEVSCVLRQYDGEIHGSLRSISRVDVSVIAQSLGGGGHRYAAGFTTSGSIDSVLDHIRRHLVDSHV